MDADPVIRPRANLSARPRVQAEERSAIRKRLQLLKQWRLEHARHLDIDAGLLWPAASLERLSANPSILEEEFESREVRRWQREEFGASLSAFLSALCFSLAGIASHGFHLGRRSNPVVLNPLLDFPLRRCL